MEFKHALYDGKSKTGTDHSTAVNLIDLVVTIPDLRDLLCCNSLSCIADADAYATVLDGLPNRDREIVSCVVYRVIDQVIQHLQDHTAVGKNRYACVCRKGNAVTLMCRKGIVAPHDLLYCGGQVKFFKYHLARAGLDLGKIQKIAYKLGKSRGFINNDLDVFGGVFAGNITHNLAIPLDHRQRCAQIMRNVGDKLLLQAVKTGKLMRGIVQCVCKLACFTVSLTREHNVVFSVCQLLCRLVHVDKWRRDMAVKVEYHNGGAHKKNGEDP